METINVTISWSGNNYCAGIGNINGVVMVTSKTLEGVKDEFAEAFRFHLQGSIADGDAITPYLANGEYEINYVLETSALLRAVEKYTTIAAISRITGINQQQLSHYANATSIPRPKQREKIIEGIHQIGREFISVV